MKDTSMSGVAFAGHAGDTGMNALGSLMPHQIGIVIAGLVLIVLTLGVVLVLALRRISRLERRIASMEKVHLDHTRQAPSR